MLVDCASTPPDTAPASAHSPPNSRRSRCPTALSTQAEAVVRRSRRMAVGCSASSTFVGVPLLMAWWHWTCSPTAQARVRGVYASQPVKPDTPRHHSREKSSRGPSTLSSREA